MTDEQTLRFSGLAHLVKEFIVFDRGTTLLHKRDDTFTAKKSNRTRLPAVRQGSDGSNGLSRMINVGPSSLPAFGGMLGLHTPRRADRFPAIVFEG